MAVQSCEEMIAKYMIKRCSQLQTGIEISPVLRDLITVIFCY